MTRIIAGAARSLTLTVPPAGTRPTSDRVRESLFGALQAADAIADATALDLFAGSGALGLEALSRGASSVDLVEKAPKAAQILRRNAVAVEKASGAPSIAQSAATSPRARVHASAVDAFLRAAAEHRRWDLVFLDPPYDVDGDALSRTLELLAPRVAPEGIVVIERATRSGAPLAPSTLRPDRDKRYGDTTLWWFTGAS